MIIVGSQGPHMGNGMATLRTSRQPRPRMAQGSVQLRAGALSTRTLVLGASLSPTGQISHLRKGRPSSAYRLPLAFEKNNKTKNTIKPHCASVQLLRAAACRRGSCPRGSVLCGRGRMWGTQRGTGTPGSAGWGAQAWFPDSLEPRGDFQGRGECQSWGWRGSVSHRCVCVALGLSRPGYPRRVGLFYQIPPPSQFPVLMAFLCQLRNRSICVSIIKTSVPLWLGNHRWTN